MRSRLRGGAREGAPLTTRGASTWGRVAQSLVLLGLEGASLGLAGWAAGARFDLMSHVLSNALDPAAQRVPVAWAGAGALVAILLGCACLLGGARGAELLQRAPRRLAPLLVAWMLPVLWEYRLWQSRELPFLLMAMALVAGAQRLFALALATPAVFPRWAETSRTRAVLAWLGRSRRIPLILTLGAILGYVWFFSYFTIRNHYRLGTASFDLGIENNLVWNAVHWGPLFKTSPLGGPSATHLGYHQTYFAYVLGIVYRLAPGPEILLVLQAVLMGGAAFPLYLIARRQIGPWPACFVAFLYVLYPPLHGAALYDFHYLPLATFFLWLTLYLVEVRRYVWAGLSVLLTLSVREDISALLVVIGAFLTMRGERPIAGLVVSAIGAAYFVGIKMILMPRFLSGGEAYIHQYAGLLPSGETGFGGVLKTVIGNPAFTMSSLLEREKLIYFLKIAAPLAFFPWRRPIGLLCTVPGFFFTLLATRYPPLIQISFQYTTYWTTFLFLAVIANLSWLSGRCRGDGTHVRTFRASRAAWLVALGLGTLVTTHQFGAILQQHTVIGGFGPYRFDLTPLDRARHERLYRLIAQVPPDAKIVSSEMIVPQVSNRKNSYTLRTGLYDADYLLVWMPPSGFEANEVVTALKGGSFGVVDVNGEFLLARRGYPTAKNQAIIERYRW